MTVKWGTYYVGPPTNEKLSKNFTVSEFRSKDGANQVVISKALVDMLQKLRDKIGKPVIINSAYRTPQHNAAVGGASSSQHMYGTGADIRVDGMSPKELGRIAREVGFPYVKDDYPSHVHVDVRGLEAATPEGRQPVKVLVDGKKIAGDAYVEDGRTMVPVRFIAEALGAKVEWDQATRTVKITQSTSVV